MGTHHWGVQSVFTPGQLKKTGKFCHFWKRKKCCNSAKNGPKCPKSKSPSPPINNVSSLQISAHLTFKCQRKSKIYTFLVVPITFVKKVMILDFLGHLMAKLAEIWSENRFLKIIRGDFDFEDFWPFLAELWHFFVFENGKIWPFFKKWVQRHLKTVCTHPCWVPTQPQWQGGCLGTHKPRGWLNKKWKKTYFFEKALIFLKNDFFQKS